MKSFWQKLFYPKYQQELNEDQVKDLIKYKLKNYRSKGDRANFCETGMIVEEINLEIMQ